MGNLRQFLGKLISESGESWYKPEFFKRNILNKIPPELELVLMPPKEESNYNCFLYALGLSERSEIIKETKGFIYSPFVEKLIAEKEVEVIDVPNAGDYVLYRNPDQFGSTITHIGVTTPDVKVLSKWSWGPLLKHNLKDVPDFYGDDLFYIKAITPEVAQNLYQRYKEFNKL